MVLKSTWFLHHVVWFVTSKFHVNPRRPIFSMHTTQLHERVARTLMFLNISQVDFTCGLELVAIAFFFAFASHKMRLICVFNHQVQGHNRKSNPLPLTSNTPETSGLICMFSCWGPNHGVYLVLNGTTNYKNEPLSEQKTYETKNTWKPWKKWVVFSWNLKQKHGLQWTTWNKQCWHWKPSNSAKNTKPSAVSMPTSS